MSLANQNYSVSFAWNVLLVGSLGNLQLPEATGVPGWAWFLALTVAAVLFREVELTPRPVPVAAGGHIVPRAG